MTVPCYLCDHLSLFLYCKFSFIFKSPGVLPDLLVGCLTYDTFVCLQYFLLISLFQSLLFKMPHPKAEAFKAEGNKFFKDGQYSSAIAKYKEATAIDSTVPAYWSNMAACYEKLQEFDEMEEAARGCIKADKSFVKGYFRLATALKNKNDLEGCIKSLESGLAVDSSNADLKKMKRDLTELQRGETVAAYIRKCEEQMANGDIAAAHKTLELASRMDAGNPDIERMMSKVKPKYERMEAQRKANLSPDEMHKERGDEVFKTPILREQLIIIPNVLRGCSAGGNLCRTWP